MDLNLPGTDGIAGLRLLEGAPSTARIPVVIVSTRSETAAVETCGSIGCDGLVHKPIDRERLRSTVTRLLEENGGEAELSPCSTWRSSGFIAGPDGRRSTPPQRF